MNYSSKQRMKQVQKQHILNEFRKITPEDTFPCYSCFDQFDARQNCLICNGEGYLIGDNPMVMFIDDFLNKNLPEQLYDQYTEQIVKSQCNSQQSDDDKFMLLNRNNLINRKECRSALESYTTKRQIQKEQNTRDVMKSSNPLKKQQSQQAHENYACNYCAMDPIKGLRYHCCQCDDYDLCQECYKGKKESQDHQACHKMSPIQAPCKVKPNQLFQQLRKSCLFKCKKQ